MSHIVIQQAKDTRQLRARPLLRSTKYAHKARTAPILPASHHHIACIATSADILTHMHSSTARQEAEEAERGKEIKEGNENEEAVTRHTLYAQLSGATTQYTFCARRRPG